MDTVWDVHGVPPLGKFMTRLRRTKILCAVCAHVDRGSLEEEAHKRARGDITFSINTVEGGGGREWRQHAMIMCVVFQ